MVSFKVNLTLCGPVPSMAAYDLVNTELGIDS